MYAKVQPGRYDTKYGEKWTVDLLLDKESLKIAKAEKLRIKKTSVNRETGDAVVKYGNLFDGYDGSYLRLERSLKDFSGKEREAPKLVDNKLKPVPNNVMIGNGSEVYAQFLVKQDDVETIKKYGGRGTFFLGMQILNLVEYEGRVNEDTDFVEEDGDGIVKGDSAEFSAEGDGNIDEAFNWYPAPQKVFTNT